MQVECESFNIEAKANPQGRISRGKKERKKDAAQL